MADSNSFSNITSQSNRSMFDKMCNLSRLWFECCNLSFTQNLPDLPYARAMIIFVGKENLLLRESCLAPD